MKKVKISRDFFEEGTKVLHPGGDTFQGIFVYIPSEVRTNRLALFSQEDKGQITDVYTCEWLVSSGESGVHG